MGIVLRVSGHRWCTTMLWIAHVQTKQPKDVLNHFTTCLLKVSVIHYLNSEANKQKNQTQQQLLYCSVLFITFGLSIILFKSSIEHTCDYEFIQTVLLLKQMDSINYSINVDCYFDFCDNGYDYPSQHPPSPQIVLKFIGIMFYAFGYLNGCKFDIFGDLNNLEKRLELEFENVNCGDLGGRYDYPPIFNPTTAPSQQPTIIVHVFVNEMKNEINKHENKNKLELIRM